MFWFLSDPKRLLDEEKSIKELQDSVEWLQNGDWSFHDGKKLVYSAEICCHNKSYPINMIYPSSYPSCPPSVYPKDKDKYWSTHQYGIGGELCLEWGPDTWLPEITGVEVLKSVFKLLNLEETQEESGENNVPSRHYDTIGRKLRSHYSGRFLYCESLPNYIEDIPIKSIGTFSTVTSIVSPIIVVKLIDISPEKKEKLCFDIPVPIMKDASGCFFVTSIEENMLNIDKLDELLTILSNDGFDISKLPSSKNATNKNILIFDVKKKVHFFWIKGGDSPCCSKYDSIPLNIKKNEGRLKQEYNQLLEKKVGIVGLGSVGSKIATSLARSGVGQFLLIDDDIMFSENIYRNDLDWNYVGFHKVDAVKHRIQQISSSAQVDIRRIQLAGQEGAASVASALDQLSGCDIIIDGTSEFDSFNQLAFFCKNIKKTMIWGEVFAGGIGGVIARYRPGIEPSPFKMRDALSQYSVENDFDYAKSTGSDYTAEKHDGQIIEASDADVSIIAYHLVNIIIDTLLCLHKYPQSLYLIGLDKGWCFEQPLEAIPINISSIDKGDEIVENISKEEGVQALKFIEDCLKKGISDDNNSSK